MRASAYIGLKHPDLFGNVRIILVERGMVNVLLNKGYQVFYEQLPSGHDYLSWGETLGNGLISLIGE